MRIAISSLVLLALAIPVDAGHCTGTATSAHTLDAAGFYVDEDLCTIQQDCIGSVWVYQETNGIAGLQRQDDVRDDTCHGMIAPDALIL